MFYTFVEEVFFFSFNLVDEFITKIVVVILVFILACSCFNILIFQYLKKIYSVTYKRLIVTECHCFSWRKGVNDFRQYIRKLVDFLIQRHIKELTD